MEFGRRSKNGSKIPVLEIASEHCSEEQVIREEKHLGLVPLLHVCVCLLSFRAVWHLGTTTSPRLCA